MAKIFTWCETKTCSGPTSAKNPIYNCVSEGWYTQNRGWYTNLVDIVNHAIHYFTFEWLEHNGAIPRNELGLATPTDDHPFSDIEDRNDGYDVSESSWTCAFDICVQLGLQELEHPRTEVGRVQKDCVG